jgi:hypothetical protein
MSVQEEHRSPDEELLEAVKAGEITLADIGSHVDAGLRLRAQLREGGVDATALP